MCKFYCLKCGQKFGSKSYKKVTLKNGSNALKTEHSCGTTCYLMTG